MDKLKQWIALTVAGVLAIVAAGWFLLIAPKHSEASDLKLQASQEVTAAALLSSKIAMLKAQAKDLPKQQARLAAVAAKIPDNPALPALIRALTKAADEANVELVSLSPSTPTPVAAAAGAKAAPVTAATTTNSATSSASAGSAATGTLQSIALSLNVVGGYFQVEQFLDRLENLSRAAKVTGFTLAPGSNPLTPAAAAASDPGKVLGATINGNVYMASGRTLTVTTTTAGK